MKKYEILRDDKLEYKKRTLYRIRALISFGTVKAGSLGGYIESEHNLEHEGEAWVFGNAKVYDNAKVFGNAQVLDCARVSGNAQVFGDARVYGMARVYGIAWVFGMARVYGNAQVYSEAQVSGTTTVYDTARVYGIARVYGNNRVYGKARVFGEAQVSGNAQVYGTAQVYGNAWVSDFGVISETNMVFWASNVGTENGTLTVFNGKEGLIVTRGCFVGTVDKFLSKSAQVHDERTKREYQLLIEVARSRILGATEREK